MCLTNSIILFVIYTLIIFSIRTPNCLGWPLDASLDLSFILGRAKCLPQIDLTSQLTHLRVRVEAPSTFNQYTAPSLKPSLVNGYFHLFILITPCISFDFN